MNGQHWRSKMFTKSRRLAISRRAKQTIAIDRLIPPSDDRPIEELRSAAQTMMLGKIINERKIKKRSPDEIAKVIASLCE